MIKNKIRRTKIIGRNRNGGFTLVETLVTMSIIIILLAIGLAGILRYRDYLRITELDNMARSIYMAAQNRAVLLDNDRRFQTVVKGVPQADGTFPDGGCTKITLKDSGKERWYIDSKTSKTAVLDDLLPAGTIDPALRNGRFYIVYEAESASVTDVFYVEKQDYDLAAEFSGIADALEQFGADDRRDARMNNKKDNKSVMVGWFGSNAAAPRDKKLKLPDPGVEILIVNGNELTLQVTYTMPTKLPAGVEMKDVTRVPSVVLEYKKSDGSVESIDLLTSGRLKKVYDITTGTVTEAKYTWVLDSLNSSGGSQRFTDLASSGLTDLGGDFTVTAGLKLSAADCSDSSWYVSDTDNSLFAEDTYNGSVAYIDNLRHLQNLDAGSVEDKGSGVGSGITTAEQRADIDAGTLKDNADKVIKTDYEFTPIENAALLCYQANLNGDVPDGNADEPYSIESLKVTAESAAARGNAGLFAEAKGTGTDEENTFRFQNVRLIDPEVTVTVKDKAAGALVGSAENVLLENCQVVNTNSGKSIASTNGIAGGLAGTAKNVNFKNCQASGVCVIGDTTGGLAGSTEAAKFVDCRIVAEVAEDSLKIKIKNKVDGKVYAGGMVGNATGECLFQGCQVSGTEVTGIDNESVAGGLSGSTKGAKFVSYTAPDGTVKNCTAEDVTVNAKKYAGGMAGYNEENIVSFENCQVILTKVTSTDGIAGGIAGADNGVSNADFKNCGIENLRVESTSSSAGGMLGCKSLGSVTFNNCTIQKDGSGNIADNDERKGINITGGSNAGGMLGYTDYKVTIVDDAERIDYNATATFTNCIVGKADDTSTIIITAERYAGGLAGDSAGGLFKNCRVYSAAVSGTGSEGRAGGLAGNTSAEGFTDCIMGESGKVIVKATMYAGGLAGTSNVGPFLGCQVVNAEVTCSAAGSMAGGLAGNTGAAEFIGCTVGNSGEVTVSAVRIAGGLAGNSWNSSAKFTNCTVGENGKITFAAGEEAGGLVGYTNATQFTGCAIKGSENEKGEKTVNITAGNFTGGLVGYSEGWAVSVNFESCKVAGAKVTDTGNIAGGLVGYNWGSALGFDKCGVSDLIVKGQGSAGGLIGCKGAGSVAFNSCKAGEGYIDISGGNNAGGLLGYISSQCKATFTDCTVGVPEDRKISISGNVAGGLAGNMDDGSSHFQSCSAVGKIVAPENSTSNFTVSGVFYIGALAGKTTNDEFISCTVKDVKVDLTGWNGCYAGGLTGLSEGSSFSKCTVSGGSVTTHDNASNEIGGLAGSTTKVSFSNCGAKNVTITGGTSAGGLVGRPVAGSFENCTAEWEDNKNVTVKTQDYAGGLAGNAIGSSFKDCTITKANVESAGDTGVAGGLAARTSGNVTIEGCKSIDARVKAKSYAGGLLGEMINTTLTGCQVYLEKDIGNSTTDYRVIAKLSSGGLVGITTGNGKIKQSFAATLVQGTTNVGGLAGALSVPKDKDGKPLSDNHPEVNIETSYANCYLTAGGGTDAPYAGGLVGSKEVNVDLTLKDVYAAGFITMEGSLTKTAAGLCSGYAFTKEDKSDVNAAEVTNAYSAMHYTSVDRIQPLADEVAPDEVKKCYYLKFKGDNTNAGVPYAQMGKLSLDAPFGQSPCESHPYNIYVLSNEVRSVYPFPWLEGLPHYGDWVTQNMADAVNVLSEEPEAVSDGDVLTVSGGNLPKETENPDETPDEEVPSVDEEGPDEEIPPVDEETENPHEEIPPVDEGTPDGEVPPVDEGTPDEDVPPGDGEAPGGEENPGTDETENPDETSENNNISPPQPEAVVPSGNNDVGDSADDESSQGGGNPMSGGGGTS